MRRNSVIGIMVLALLSISGGSVFAAIDTLQAPRPYFVPSDFNKEQSPWYRGYDEDWGWAHNPIAEPITSGATLSIKAYDVDSNIEVDNIYAYDDGSQVLLGSLTGAHNQWSYTTFILGPEFYDDILTGLWVWMDIDANDYQYARVSLEKSELEVNGNPVPIPPALFLMAPGLFWIGVIRRRYRTN